MQINDTIFTVELMSILVELQSQLALNGIKLLGNMKQTGHNIMVCCPYHKDGQERKPSAGIDMRDGTFHCFACGETHSLPEMITHCFGKNDVLGTFGWNWLLKNFMTVSVESRKDIDLDISRTKIKAKSKVEFVSDEELDSYRYIHPYMYKRKMTDEIIELFDIGYDKNTKCITFPVRDIDGNTLFIARRSVQTKFFNYPVDVEKPVYGLYELNATKLVNGHKVHILPNFPDEVIICESMIDCITCWVYGKFAVALNGLGNELQFDQLRKMPCRKFILATDMDNAGRRARVRLKRELRGKIVTEYLWDLTIAKDINDMTEDYFNSLKEVF